MELFGSAFGSKAASRRGNSNGVVSVRWRIQAPAGRHFCSCPPKCIQAPSGAEYAAPKGPEISLGRFSTKIPLLTELRRTRLRSLRRRGAAPVQPRLDCSETGRECCGLRRTEPRAGAE